MKKQILTLLITGTCLFKGYAQSTMPDPVQTLNEGTSNLVAGQPGALEMIADDVTGNVGIGTASPNANLHIVSFGNGIIGTGSEGFTTAASAGSVVEIDNNSTVVYSSNGSIINAPLNYSLMITRNSTTVGAMTTSSATTDMVVDGNGNTGVGLATPKTRLDVYGPSTGGPDLFRVANDKIPVIYATAAGNVGIGNSSPAYTLDVTGNANVQTVLNVGLEGSDAGQVKINAPGLAPGSTACYMQVSDPSVMAIEIQEQFQSSSTPYPIDDKFVVFADGRTAIGDFTGVSNPFPTGVVSGGNTIPYMLYVNGAVLAQKYKCALSSDATNWSDYVFDKDYKLASLDQVKSYIEANHHLPDVPSTEDVLCDGIDMAQMDATLLKKIEELTLYMLNQQKEIETLKSQLATTKK